MNAAIYCRVSTDNQEREGTSLQTQLENCLTYCQGKGYDVSYRFSETCSGLTIDRPKLNELRELVRAGDIDVVVVYCLDRLSRNATHGVILRDELDKHHVLIESITEDIDKTPLGEAITYLRGTFSQIEAEKIRERTMRGKRARAREGKIPSGGFHRLFGYDYIAVREKQGGRRVINEDEAKWVREMFHWLVDKEMATLAMAKKLNNLNVLSKCGNRWSRQTVHHILSNLAYTGKTLYDDIELSPDLTPQIIDEALFKAAQKQLEINYKKARRNIKREYLLHGHIYCRQCRRAYWASTCIQRKEYGNYEYRRYACSGSSINTMSYNRCHNKGWMADELEGIVWQEIEKVLSQPEIIVSEIENQRQQADHTNHIEAELKYVQRQIKALNKEQEQLLQWALKGFPEETVIATNKSINDKKENLIVQEEELGLELRNCREATKNLPKMEQFIGLIRDKLTNPDYETKRLALEALSIKVWIDDHNVEITGSIPIQDFAIAQPSSAMLYSDILSVDLEASGEESRWTCL